jgi:hypothetical protein
MSFTAPLSDAVADRGRAVDAVAFTTLLVATLDLVVPAVLLAGYLVRLIRADGTLPPVTDAVSLLGTGLRASTLVALAATPVAAARLSAAATAPSGGLNWVAVSLTSGQIPPWPWLLGSVVTLSSLVVAALLAPLSGYLALVIVTRYAAGDFATALDVDSLRRTLTDRRNVRASAVVFAVLVVAGGASTAAGFAPFGPASSAVRSVFVAGGTVAAAVLWRANAVVTLDHARTDAVSTEATDSGVVRSDAPN